MELERLERRHRGNKHVALVDEGRDAAEPLAHGPPVHPDGAVDLARRPEARQDLEEGRLARAGRAHDGAHLARDDGAGRRREDLLGEERVPVGDGARELEPGEVGRVRDGEGARVGVVGRGPAGVAVAGVLIIFFSSFFFFSFRVLFVVSACAVARGEEKEMTKREREPWIGSGRKSEDSKWLSLKGAEREDERPTSGDTAKRARGGRKEEEEGRRRRESGRRRRPREKEAGGRVVREGTQGLLLSLFPIHHRFSDAASGQCSWPPTLRNCTTEAKTLRSAAGRASRGAQSRRGGGRIEQRGKER